MKHDSIIVKLDSIDAYNKLYGLETRHPLVTVLNLTEATRVVNHIQMDYGVYALYLKNGVSCTLKYGRQAYDYQEGTVVSFSPGHIIGVESETDELAPDVIGLMFHPDLIYGTPLAAKIKNYSFFDYSQREALHLSLDERRLFIECLDHIKNEIEHPVDNHTAEIVASHIQVLLDYLSRFYERQFITRRKVNSDVLTKFEKALKEYYADGHGKDGVPTVNYFAEIVNLTPGYFGDLVKKETGKTAQELISLRIIEFAKQQLATTNDDISIVAYDLGFQYPQHFSRMFKRITGISPKQFREKISVGYN
ncbi:AraC family transcriptional regulator [Muribaculum sp.]|uniref:helix-turn-helix domain-containing protein n=1 Tax=Muribaculum sp. TaxID=1918611 RepID=UPI0023C20518|nr:helix-turn-helix domain-containing protein [Muribaculum sp.]MDE5706305.1 helix-turn-helix domain-containing protein [Muribaculum sp.]